MAEDTAVIEPQNEQGEEQGEIAPGKEDAPPKAQSNGASPNGKANGNSNGAKSSSILENPKTTVRVNKRDGKFRVQFENSPHVIHPDVALLGIPNQTSDEYLALTDDIRKKGRINEPIVKAKDPITKQVFVVDGKHRQEIADELGYSEGKQYTVKFIGYDEAMDYAVSASQRRNLTDEQKAVLAVNLLEAEKQAMANRQKASARVTNLIRGAQKPEIIEVPYPRLITTGEIGRTLSGDVIMVTSKSQDSKLRGVFERNSEKFTAVDGSPGSRIVGYRVVGVSEYRENGGKLTNYVTRSEEWKTQPDLGYDGILVRYKNIEGKDVVAVLQGPPVVFVPSEVEGEGVPETKKKGRASEAVAQKVGAISARTVEMAAYVEKNDPEAWERIKNGDNQPGTGLPESVNSAYTRIKLRESQSEEGAGKDDSILRGGLPNPDAMTVEEFVEKHPLYAQLKSREDFPIFVEAVRNWTWCNKALQSLKMQAAKSKLLTNGNPDEFSNTIRAATMCSTHPYNWDADDKKPGGFTIRSEKTKQMMRDAVKANAPKPAPKANVKDATKSVAKGASKGAAKAPAKNPEASGGPGKPFFKPEKAAKGAKK